MLLWGERKLSSSFVVALAVGLSPGCLSYGDVSDGAVVKKLDLLREIIDESYRLVNNSEECNGREAPLAIGPFVGEV